MRMFKRKKKKEKGGLGNRLRTVRFMAEGGRAPYLSEDADGAGHAHLPDAHHRYLAAGHRASGGHGGHQLLLQGRHSVLREKARVSTAGYDPTTTPLVTKPHIRYRPHPPAPAASPLQRPGAPASRQPHPARTHRLRSEQGDAEPFSSCPRRPAMRDPQRKGRPPTSRAAPPPTAPRRAPGAGPSAVRGRGLRAQAPQRMGAAGTRGQHLALIPLSRVWGALEKAWRDFHRPAAPHGACGGACPEMGGIPATGGPCASSLFNRRSLQWGSLQWGFLQPGFPAMGSLQQGFTATKGYCNGVSIS